MKTLIVIDLPEDHLIKATNDLYDRLKGYQCELKPMPRKKSVYQEAGLMTDVVNLTNIGWNACIEEILGETE